MLNALVSRLSYRSHNIQFWFSKLSVNHNFMITLLSSQGNRWPRILKCNLFRLLFNLFLFPKLHYILDCLHASYLDETYDLVSIDNHGKHGSKHLNMQLPLLVIAPYSMNHVSHEISITKSSSIYTKPDHVALLYCSKYWRSPLISSLILWLSISFFGKKIWNHWSTINSLFYP